MQQPQPAMGPMGSVPPPNITTEQIQKYLDENKQLILAILDNQNLGRLSECAQFQAQLQKNLLYLAAIADAQPQAPAVRLQMTPQGGMPQASSPYMQQQSPNFPPKAQMQFTHQQAQELQQQQLQHQPHMMPFQGQMGLRPVSIMNGMHAAVHAESSSLGHNNKQGAGNAASQNTDASIQKKSANEDLEPAITNLRKPEDAKSS